MHRYDGIAALAAPLIVLWLAVFSAAAISQPAANAGNITQDMIDATVETVKGGASLPDATRDDLLAKLAAASNNLDTAAQQTQREKELRQAMQGAPDKSAKFKQQLAQAGSAGQSLQDMVGKAPTLEAINSQVTLVEADLQAKTARRDHLQQEIDGQADRNAAIQARLVELQSKLGDFSAPSPAPEGSLGDRVVALGANTKAQAWRAEQGSLEAEVLSAASLADLRAAELDWLNHAIDLARADLAMLTDAANFARGREAEKNLQSIDALEAQVQRQNPLLQQLVDANRALAQQQQKTSGPMDQARADSTRLKARLESIRNDVRLMRLRLEVAGRKDELGPVMGRLLTSLPDTAALEREVETRNAQISEVSLSMIDTEEQRKKVSKWDSYLQSLGITASTLERRELTSLDLLLEQRRQLLDDSKSLQDNLSRLLIDNNAQARSLIRESADFEGYLVGNLLWVRDYGALSLEALLHQAGVLLAPENWRQLPGQFSRGLQASTWSVVLLLALLVVTLLARRSRTGFDQMMTRPMPLRTMQASHIFAAVGWALLLVLPGALAVHVAGTILQAAEPRTEFLNALTPAIQFLAPALYTLLFLRILLDDTGLGRRLFKWNVQTIKGFRAEVIWLAPVLLGAGFISVFSTQLDAVSSGGPLDALATLVSALAIAIAAVRLLHRHVFYEQRFAKAMVRVLGIVSLIIIGMLALGLLFAADTYLLGLGYSFFAVMSIKVVADILERWLLVLRVRLEHNARSEIAARQEEGEDAAEEQDDLEDVVSLSLAHAKLLTMSRFVATALALWFIWAPMLPALNLLDTVELWRVADTASADGGFRIISLFNLMVAIVVLVLTGLFARHLPSIIQVTLMEWFHADSGVRYAAGILTQYVLVGVGASTALNLIGWEWSKVQWLVAALGVGIGFGLQEIVANFISGLIVLFERPIRVGDTVSVGSTEGTVRKIKSRATVIETFDMKEVMVPNKALITGEVTNWSLSEEAVRIMVSVGIAYEDDPELAMGLLLEASRETDLVLCDPEPAATFDNFGDNSLVLTLRCYVAGSRPAAWTKLRSLIFRKFTDAGITIAFPQRDVNLNITRPVNIQLDPSMQPT